MEETVWGQAILAYGKNALEYAAFTLEEALWEIRSDEKMEAAYGPAYESDLQGVRAALERVEAGDWDGVKAALDSFSFPRLKALRGFSNDPLKERVQAARKQVKELIETLAEKQFCATRAQFREDIDDLLPKITRLFEVTLAFDRRFTEKKPGRQAGGFLRPGTPGPRPPLGEGGRGIPSHCLGQTGFTAV